MSQVFLIMWSVRMHYNTVYIVMYKQQGCIFSNPYPYNMHICQQHYRTLRKLKIVNQRHGLRK